MLHKSEEKKVWVLQKSLSEGCIKGYHLLKKSGLSDHYLHFYGWFLVVDVTEKMWNLVSYSCKKCFIKVKKIKFELCKSPCQKDAWKVTICWKKQVDQINFFTFMDDIVVDVREKIWILVSYNCKKWFIKVKKKVGNLQKPLSKGCTKGDHLLKKSGCSDQYLHFNAELRSRPIFGGSGSGSGWIVRQKTMNS